MAKVDEELDLHGYTAANARAALELAWASRRWHGMRRVRVIHGNGATLWSVVRQWSAERGIEFTIEPHNAGVTVLLPSLGRSRHARATLGPLRAPGAHRPLADSPHLRQRRAERPAAPRARVTPPSPAAPSEPPPPHDAHLFDAEMARLAGQERDERRRRGPRKRGD